MLFVHRVSKNASTKCSPSKLQYNREPVLSIDIKHNLDETLYPDEPFGKGMFDAVLVSLTEIRNEIHSEAGENIKKSTEKIK